MPVTELAHAVVAFYEGARNHAIGALLTNNNVISAALKQIDQALAIIDVESENGRDVLIPFLRHADAMVRCEAAQALHPSRRDLATPVLQDISLTCITEACTTAKYFLIFAGEPNKSSDLMQERHPHRYDSALYNEALERLARNDRV